MKKRLIRLLLFLLSLVILIPFWMLLTGSMTGRQEWREILLPLEEGRGTVLFPLIPSYPTLRPWVQLLLGTPEFFGMFWNSCKLVFPVIAGQVLVGAPAAWALTKLPLKGREGLRFFYIVLMLLPFQVTMVSNYLVLDFLSLIDTRWAIILPGIFSPFAVFLMMEGFRGIPEAVIESAWLDGASPLRCFFSIGLPLGFPGVLSAVVLGFLEYWAMMEQPMIFLKNQSLWPVSLFTPTLSAEIAATSFVAAILILAPGLLVFLFGQHDLERGIAASGVKE